MDSDEMSSSTTGAQEEGAAAAVVSDVSSQDRFADIKERFESGSDLSDADVDAIADVALTYVRQIMTFFGEEHVTIDEYDGDDGELILDVSGDDLAVFIGRHGRTLDALQMLVTSYMSNVMRFHYPIVIDIEGYKARRRQKLVSFATQAEAHAIKQRGEVRLAPMNAYERRIVHLTLANSERVSTHSEGVDPQRRVVVTFVH